MNNYKSSDHPINPEWRQVAQSLIDDMRIMANSLQGHLDEMDAYGAPPLGEVEIAEIRAIRRKFISEVESDLREMIRGQF